MQYILKVNEFNSSRCTDRAKIFKKHQKLQMLAYFSGTSKSFQHIRIENLYICSPRSKIENFSPSPRFPYCQHDSLTFE